MIVVCLQILIVFAISAICHSQPVVSTLLVEPRTTAHYFQAKDVNERCEDLISVWKSILLQDHISVEIVSDNSIPDDLQKFDLIILPGTLCLSNKSLESIDKYVSTGEGGLLLTWGTGFRDEYGKWRGASFIGNHFGVAPKKSNRRTNQQLSLRLRDGYPGTLSIDPGYRLKLTSAHTPLFLPDNEVSSSAGYWSEDKFDPGILPEQNSQTGYAIRQTETGSRIAWFGCNLDQLEFNDSNNEHVKRVFHELIEWLSGSGISSISPWPKGYNAAMVIHGNYRTEIDKIQQAQSIFNQKKVAATFSILTRNIKKNISSLKSIDTKHFEFCLIGDTDTELSGLDVKEQVRIIQNYMDCYNNTNIVPIGFLPAFQTYDDNTIEALFQNGIKYLLANNLSNQAVPFASIQDFTDSEIVIFPKVDLNDYDIIHRLKATDPERIAEIMISDAEKKWALNGLYRFTYHSDITSPENLELIADKIIKKAKSKKNVWLGSTSEIAEWRLKLSKLLITQNINEDQLDLHISNNGNYAIKKTVLRILPPRNIPAERMSTVSLSQSTTFDVIDGVFYLNLPELEPGKVFRATFEKRSGIPLSATTKKFLSILFRVSLFIAGAFIVALIWWFLRRAKRSVNILDPEGNQRVNSESTHYSIYDEKERPRIVSGTVKSFKIPEVDEEEPREKVVQISNNDGKEGLENESGKITPDLTDKIHNNEDVSGIIEPVSPNNASDDIRQSTPSKSKKDGSSPEAQSQADELYELIVTGSIANDTSVSGKEKIKKLKEQLARRKLSIAKQPVSQNDGQIGPQSDERIIEATELTQPDLITVPPSSSDREINIETAPIKQNGTTDFQEFQAEGEIPEDTGQIETTGENTPVNQAPEKHKQLEQVDNFTTLTPPVTTNSSSKPEQVLQPAKTSAPIPTVETEAYSKPEQVLHLVKKTSPKPLDEAESSPKPKQVLQPAKKTPPIRPDEIESTEKSEQVLQSEGITAPKPPVNTKSAVEPEQVLQSAKITAPLPPVNTKSAAESKQVFQSAKITAPKPPVKIKSAAETEQAFQSAKITAPKPPVRTKSVAEPEQVFQSAKITAPKPPARTKSAKKPEPPLHSARITTPERLSGIKTRKQTVKVTQSGSISPSKTPAKRINSANSIRAIQNGEASTPGSPRFENPGQKVLSGKISAPRPPQLKNRKASGSLNKHSNRITAPEPPRVKKANDDSKRTMGSRKVTAPKPPMKMKPKSNIISDDRQIKKPNKVVMKKSQKISSDSGTHLRSIAPPPPGLKKKVLSSEHTKIKSQKIAKTSGRSSLRKGSALRTTAPIPEKKSANQKKTTVQNPQKKHQANPGVSQGMKEQSGQLFRKTTISAKPKVVKQKSVATDWK